MTPKKFLYLYKYYDVDEMHNIKIFQCTHVNACLNKNFVDLQHLLHSAKMFLK